MNIYKLIKNNSILWIVIVVLVSLISLPTVGVVVMASSGSTVITSSLINFNKTTKMVDLFYPNGSKIYSVKIETQWPTTGIVTDEFGTHDNWRKLLGLGPHSGIDISRDINTPVAPFMEGVIQKIDPLDNSDCGINITIKHQYNIESYYCHLQSISNISVGSTVSIDQIIGYMGNTGTSTGSHLHLSIKVYGVLVDPRIFLEGQPNAN